MFYSIFIYKNKLGQKPVDDDKIKKLYWNSAKFDPKCLSPEPELVWEVELYQLDLVGFTSKHSCGSGSVLLDRGRTLFFSRVDQGVRPPPWRVSPG